MKILLVTQYYWPENSRITDIAESLQKENNDVTVLTGLPNYPQGYIYEGYRNGKNRIQEHNKVQIIRAKLIERRHDVFHRFLNYYSFPYYAKKVAMKLPNDFDIILAIGESPIMLVKPAITYARKYKKPLIMYEMDLWPESLLAGGISNKSIIYKYYKKVSSKIYSQFDKILVTTKEHISYIKSLPSCENLNIDYLPQYADIIFEKTNFGWTKNNVIDLMFAGNIGKAQSIRTLIETAKILKDDKRFKFHIVGCGSEYENSKKLVEKMQLKNIVFYGHVPLDQMPKLYQLADVMLVTLENKSYANMTIPGKVQSYMACGKPIIGAINGSTANFIKDNNLGYVCNAEDYNSLAKLIKQLNYDDLKRIGNNSRKVYFEKFSNEHFINKLIEELKKV